ncbi:MAG TPA: GNAT family N-acetyltransferase [Acidimicrobiia bacterium]|nr:GNAT family N-acetyltransferase [Acidimicrobiia bacterium]
MTTVDLSLRFLILPQLRSIVELGGEALGISAPGPWVEDLVVEGIRHLPLNASTRGVAPLRDLNAAVELWRTLRTERPDILHTHNPKPGLYGRILGRLAGVPIVVNTVHGLYATPDDRRAKRFVVYVLEAVASRFSDAELIQSSEDLGLISKWRIAPAGRARLLGNGVNLERFRFEGGRGRAAMRADLGLEPGQIAVGMVGRLVEEKGYPELFEAARQLDDRYVVLVIGPDDTSKGDSLPAELVEGARSEGVRFLGMRTDVDDLYRALDIFVLPSHREGFPRAAMEAAASGLPVVATDIRGCREVVEDGVNGLLVPVRDPASLTKAIQRIGDDPELRARMGTAGDERARRLFDESAIVETVLDTYRQVAIKKGLVRLAEALGAGQKPVVIRRAGRSDAAGISRLHMENISAGFLSSLGLGFLKRLYGAMIAWPQAVVLVADAGAGPVGFVAGVADTGAFYKHFILRSGVPAGLAALPRLLRSSGFRKARETLRYKDTEEGAGAEVEAELLSMAVDPAFRGQGLGHRLGMELLAEPLIVEAGAVKVVVGASNSLAIAAYQKMGFVYARSIEIHAAETSRVLIWSAPSVS